MHEARVLTSIPDDELLQRLAEILRDSRSTEGDLVAHIGEVDRRRLYARSASPSMFRYCIHVLHLSEPEAYLRIVAARAARKHPVLLAMLADGRLHLSGIAKLAPHLTRENRDALLGRATHLSKRQIEELIAEICPRPDVPSLVRKLPGEMARGRFRPRRACPRTARTEPPQAWSNFLRLGAESERMARRRIESSSTWPGSARRGKAREARRHSSRLDEITEMPAEWPEPRPRAKHPNRNSVRAESAHRAASSSRSLHPATRCSSRRAHSSKTSSSGSRPCCAPRFPTAIWARSSSGP
jgi:hypothetical protein